jgi:hypothetical protein
MGLKTERGKLHTQHGDHISLLVFLCKIKLEVEMDVAIIMNINVITYVQHFIQNSCQG